jgi:hypothetical protein
VKVIIFYCSFVSLLIAKLQIFSTMNIVKTRLHNKIEDEFLTDYLMVSLKEKLLQQLA